MDQLQLENKLKALKIGGTYEKTVETPFFLDIYVKFAPDVTINRIKARTNDLCIFFGANVSIETINNDIIIRLPKNKREPVYFGSFQKDIENSVYSLPIPVGVDAAGNKVITDLSKLPHLLVAGTTGSGKSVFLNNCILSLLISNNSYLYLIDVKQVEFAIYKNIPCIDVINDISNAGALLYNICEYMDKRYKNMSMYNCRTFEEYQRIKPDEKYITIIIDELADIMIQNKKAVEKQIIRIAQLGRAAGIHLIIATQRPSADVVTGLIKANLPSRLCFCVRSGMDSRIILDQKGAELLHGNGDGLFAPVGSTPKRIQAAYISNKDIEYMINNLKQ